MYLVSGYNRRTGHGYVGALYSSRFFGTLKLFLKIKSIIFIFKNPS